MDLYCGEITRCQECGRTSAEAGTFIVSKEGSICVNCWEKRGIRLDAMNNELWELLKHYKTILDERKNP